jgi:FAD:protein FMN transferase
MKSRVQPGAMCSSIHRRERSTLPQGAGIDLGGIGKGFAVDRVAAMLGTPSLVNCGGDVFASGRPPDDGGWRVGVSDPSAPERDLMVLTVEDRGVATSSTMNRRWIVGDRQQHHLIDPRTGEPSRSGAVQVTVAAPTAVEADYHAKVALLHGAEAGMRYLNARPGIEGLAVRHDGATFQSANFGRYWSG